MFDFQDLNVYKKAKAFHSIIHLLITQNTFHKTVVDQLWRASFSNPLNIAEGSGRFSKKDRKNFFVISRSSVFEVVAILDLLNDAHSISSSEFEEFCAKAEELSKILYAMIKNLS